MFRIIKTRWYHKVWDRIFKPNEPSGFLIGQWVFNVYVTKRGQIPGKPKRYETQTIDSKRMLGVNEQRQEMQKSKKTKSIILS